MLSPKTESILFTTISFSIIGFITYLIIMYFANWNVNLAHIVDWIVITFGYAVGMNNGWDACYEHHTKE